MMENYRAAHKIALINIFMLKISELTHVNHNFEYWQLWKFQNLLMSTITSIIDNFDVMQSSWQILPIKTWKLVLVNKIHKNDVKRSFIDNP